VNRSPEKSLAFTCGDPAGIGPEIIRAWLDANPGKLGEVTVIGPARWLETLPAGVAKIPVGLEDYAATPGQPDGDGALTAWAAMERAAEGCRKVAQPVPMACASVSPAGATAVWA